MTMGIVGIGQAGLILAVAIGSGLAQQTTPEKHVNDIKHEQTWTFITGSPLCQRTMANPHALNQNRYPVDTSTLAPDLKSLMEMSEDVILTTTHANGVDAIAPSGEDVIHYEDVKVLRTWKGSYKPGDTVTVPMIGFTSVDCSPTPVDGGGPRFTTLVGAGYYSSSGTHEAYVLFLRHAQGSEKKLTPDLRMAGGSGLQGIYPVDFTSAWSAIQESHCQNDYSHDKYPVDAKQCMAFLASSNLPIQVPLTNDPLFKKYDRMPVSEFLQEVQDAADELGYAPQGNGTN